MSEAGRGVVGRSPRRQSSQQPPLPHTQHAGGQHQQQSSAAAQQLISGYMHHPQTQPQPGSQYLSNYPQHLQHQPPNPFPPSHPQYQLPYHHQQPPPHFQQQSLPYRGVLPPGIHSPVRNPPYPTSSGSGAPVLSAAVIHHGMPPTMIPASATSSGTPSGVASVGTIGNLETISSYALPRSGRLPADRPIVKLSIRLIDTYKEINRVYYREREARRAARQATQQIQTGSASALLSSQTSTQGPGTQNQGWDDDNYDYILTPNEVILNRYVLQKRIGKGSFGQVVQALDKKTNKEVAIKIIKSKRPFLMQAKTEIGLLTSLNENDPEDQHNIVQLLTHFMYRNHQCLVFEMLSLNLYELLKNTHFAGVSLNLIRKFAKQILKALAFLARRDIDIIHCDLKPENILLRHPKRSGIKVIDFGSSCNSSRRMYSYIQSRFYRSPEVMLGLPYGVAIDMWSLGCILVEMHTGEPLFSGTDQFDQMQKIVAILGMVPDDILDRTDEQHRLQFFERQQGRWTIKQSSGSTLSTASPTIIPSLNPISSLRAIVSRDSNQLLSQTEDADQTARSYNRFVDLIYQMLAYKPSDRISPEEALEHPFITNVDHSHDLG